MFENLDIKQGLPIAIYIACVASVSARVRRRERWDESKKKGMTGKGEGTVILHRDMENSVFPLLPSPSPFHSKTRLETLATQATIYIFQSMARKLARRPWGLGPRYEVFLQMPSSEMQISDEMHAQFVSSQVCILKIGIMVFPRYGLLIV